MNDRTELHSIAQIDEAIAVLEEAKANLAKDNSSVHWAAFKESGEFQVRQDKHGTIIYLEDVLKEGFTSVYLAANHEDLQNALIKFGLEAKNG